MRPASPASGQFYSRSSVDGARAAFSAEVVNLGFIALLILPAYAGGASALRIAFPAATCIAAGRLLLTGRVGQYVTFCAWLFVLTPFVRRVADYHAGWAPVNTLMLAPYTALLFTVPAWLSIFDRDRGGLSVVENRALLWLTLAIVYGLAMAVVGERAASGAFDFLRWLLPPCLAIFIFANRQHGEEIRRQVEAFVAIALPLAAFYAIYQYFYLPEWDADWMRNVDMESIGKPAPYEVRVFGTMNSPGSLGSFFLFGLTMLLVVRGPLWLLGAGLGSIALALTLSRSAWIGLATALVVVLLLGSVRTRARIILLGLAAAFVAPLAAGLPDLGDMLANRFGTLSQTSTDSSVFERSIAYQSFLDQLGDTLGGVGLGINGAYARNAGEAGVKYIDGGPIEIFLALGVIAGTLYYVATGTLAARALTSRAHSTERDQAAAYKGIVIANAVLQISSTTTVGEAGFFAWLAVGLLLSLRARGPEGRPR